LAAFKPAGHPEIAIVQENSRDAGTTTSSALAFELNNTAGNWIGVCVRVGAENANISVADSNGNKYRKAIEFNETADGNTIGIFYAENISKGANAVTVSDKMSQSLRFAILEYSGVAISGSLDVTATAQGKSASPKTGGAVTTANGDLLLGVVMTSDAESYTASSGYSIKEHVPGEPNTKLIAEDQIQVGAGTAAVSTYLGGTDIWAAGLAAFKAAGNEEGTSANFSATPASALFAGVPVGTSDSQSIQFRNLATSNVTITGLEIQGTGFGTLGLVAPLTIAAGGTTTFNIIFSPRSPGTFGGLLTLPVSGSASGLVIPLVGSAVAATRALSGNPTSVKFGNVGVNGFTTANVALLNTGNSSITIQGTTSNGTGFSASGISTRTSIAPSETAMLTVEFAPKSAGSVTGAITISTSASTTLTIPVTGTGITSTASNHVVQLNWAASASASTVGYNVYRSTVSGGPYVKMVSAPVNGTSYSDQTVKAEVEYYYVVTAIAADGLESSRSNQSTAYIP
jgi:hypothetical protein